MRIPDGGNQRLPAQLCRGLRPGVLAPRLGDVACPAEGLQVGHVVGVAAPSQRPDVIALQGAGRPARRAPPAVTVEHGAPDGQPSAGVDQGAVVPAHPTAPWYRKRRGGAAGCRAPAATARIAAAAASSRALNRRPPADCLASFALPLGSMTTRASPIA